MSEPVRLALFRIGPIHLAFPARWVEEVVRGPVEAAVSAFAREIGTRVQTAAAAAQLAPRVLGPVPAPLPKLRGNFRYHLLLSHRDQPALMQVVRQATDGLKAPADVLWIVDVDPLDML